MEVDGASQSSLVDIRRKTVTEFVKDVAAGKLYLSIDQEKWRPQDVELIGTTAGKLIRDISEYVSGAVAGEEFEFLEKQIFFSISVLRTYDALKPGFDKSEIELGVKRLETKLDNLDAKLAELLTPSIRSNLPLSGATESERRIRVREWKPPKTFEKKVGGTTPDEARPTAEDEEGLF
jgi:hypothetical protein